MLKNVVCRLKKKGGRDPLDIEKQKTKIERERGVAWGEHNFLKMNG